MKGLPWRFEQRLRKLEAKARDRLAAAAAIASIEGEPKPTIEEALKLDPDTLVRMYRESLRPPDKTVNPEYKQLFAHYRRMPLQQLVRLYPDLKRRYKARQAENQRQFDEATTEWFEDLKRYAAQFQPGGAPYKKPEETQCELVWEVADPQPARTESFTAPVPETAPAPEPWRPGQLAWAM